MKYDDDPHNYPHRFHQWNRSHQGSYKKGVRAFHAGQPIDANPYGDDRNWHGGVTWARAYWRNWHDGWTDAKRQATRQNLPS